MSYKAYLSQTQRIQSSQSGEYCSKYGVIALSFLILFFFVTPIIYAKTLLKDNNPTLCEIKIISSQIAKGTGIDHTERPITGWENVNQFPDLIESRWKDYSGSVWYKIKWDYTCNNQKAPATLVINNINMAGQIYLNNELLWQDRSLIEPLSRSWNMPRYWNLPASSLNAGENILWIRVVGVATQSSGLGKVLLGHSDEVMPLYQKFWYEQRVLHFFNLVFSLTLGIVALLVWLFRRKESVFGWFALTSLTWVLIMSNVVMINPILELTTLQIARVNIVALFSYFIFSCFYAWRLAQRSFPKTEKMLFAALATIALMAIFLPNSALGTFLMLSFIIGVLIIIINFITYPFIAYRSKKIEANLLACVFLIYLIVAVHDFLYIMKIGSGISWTAYTAPLTTLFIALILAMRLANNIRKIERFSKTLEESVVQAKSELKLSLSAQHHLELENIKLQERMNLAHDLHDGLGGSLVRSMAIVDLSRDNLSNQQFLSMLKLLRDDLRQIIDSGSSSSNDAPETPMIWGAAIRYRFVQIFDELDIQSTWNFPDQWLTRPTALECLTLLRVIEESLTNIIKHSNARYIKVDLFYDQKDQLILEIEDDGIGFDVDAVFRSGMSVGLRSMKFRIEKIGAKMDILSQAGSTRIKVIKP
nr:ATP-binding protein [Acinetobacter venetianus]